MSLFLILASIALALAGAVLFLIADRRASTEFLDTVIRLRAERIAFNRALDDAFATRAALARRNVR